MSKIPLLVVCHTVFHDAFRKYPRPTPNQNSARFLIRYIIEKMSDPDMNQFSLTSRKTLDNIFNRVKYMGYPGIPPNMRRTMESMMLIFDSNIININEEIVAGCDWFASKTTREAILTSNMKKMVAHTLKFYQDNEKTKRQWKEYDIGKAIPFIVKGTSYVEKLLNKIDSKTCKVVYSRLKKESPKK